MKSLTTTSARLFEQTIRQESKRALAGKPDPDPQLGQGVKRADRLAGFELARGVIGRLLEINRPHVMIERDDQAGGGAFGHEGASGVRAEMSRTDLPARFGNW